MKIRNELLAMGSGTIIFMVPVMWIAAAIFLFAETNPNLSTNVLRFPLIVMVMGPMVFMGILLAGYSLLRTNTSVIENKMVNGVALFGVLPAALALPFNFYPELWVLAGLLAVNQVLVLLRLRAIPMRKVTPVPVNTGSDASDEAGENEDDGSMAFPAELARHTLDALAGMNELKENLLAAAEEAMQTTSKRKGSSKLRADMRNGILLFGEPGNGKTAIAEGLAGSLGVPIIKMSFGGVASKWVNSTTENVVQLFKDARAQAPCVLFMDEVDSVISSRESAGGDTEGPKTTNQILTDLVATRGSGVVVLMATNFLDRLDQAAIREGRVDFKLLVPPPDAEARQAIITKTVARSRNGVQLHEEALEQAVKRWEGFSAARISAVVDEAVRQAEKGGFDDIAYTDLQAALRKMQGKLGERISENTPKLDDLHMPGNQHKALRGIARRMVDIEKIEEMGGSVPNGVLFAGPPGTGKTLTVRALAKTTGWPLLATTGNALMGDAKNVDELAAKAKNARPCIVFIDEADDVFANRRTQNSYAASITNKLLSAMDGAGGKAHDVLWVAAVNAPDTMDPAALRGGRFTEKVWFENPDSETAEKIVAQWLTGTKAKFHASLTPERIAAMLDGESPANIKAILQHAVNIMIARSTDGEGRQIVMPSDIEGAMNAVL